MTEGTFPDRAQTGPDGQVVYSTPDEQPSTRPMSPKVIAAAAWAFVAPVLLAAVLATVGYLATDDGRALTSSWPVVLQVAFYAAVAALSGGMAGYRQPDGEYRARREITG